MKAVRKGLRDVFDMPLTDVGRLAIDRNCFHCARMQCPLEIRSQSSILNMIRQYFNKIMDSLKDKI